MWLSFQVAGSHLMARKSPGDAQILLLEAHGLKICRWCARRRLMQIILELAFTALLCKAHGHLHSTVKN